MNKTLWKLAGSWEHDFIRGYCRRCQLEQWAREKAEEVKWARDHAVASHNPIEQGCYEEFLEGLGVPEEQ